MAGTKLAILFCDKPVGVSQRRLGAIKKNPLKKGSATDPIPATPRLTVELTFVVEKLSVELTFDYLFPLRGDVVYNSPIGYTFRENDADTVYCGLGQDTVR